MLATQNPHRFVICFLVEDQAAAIAFLSGNMANKSRLQQCMLPSQLRLGLEHRLPWAPILSDPTSSHHLLLLLLPHSTLMSQLCQCSCLWIIRQFCLFFYLESVYIKPILLLNIMHYQTMVSFCCENITYIQTKPAWSQKKT